MISIVSRETRHIYIISESGLLFFPSVCCIYWPLKRMSYFTNTHYVCPTAVTRNLQVAILLHESLTIFIHLPAFINCTVAEYCKDLTQIQTHLLIKALQWKQMNQHHKGCLVPTSGCSWGPVGLCTVLWGTAPGTLGAGWGTSTFCPTGSSSGLCEGSCSGGCRCLCQSCNSHISGEAATNPFIKEMCFPLNVHFGLQGTGIRQFVLSLECVGKRAAGNWQF